MKRRMIRFVSGQGWFYSPIFPGDATELASVNSEVSCDRTWSQIAAVMAKFKTLDEYQRGVIWAQKQYHRKCARGLPTFRLVREIALLGK